MSRCIIISDCHGQPWLVSNALSHANYDRKVDRLIFAGDICDIGFDTIECIRLLKEANAELLWGNHDLAVILNKSIWPQNKLDVETEEAIMALKDKFKVAVESYGVLITHAGLARSFKLQNWLIPGSYSNDLNHLPYDEMWHRNGPLWYRPTKDNLPRSIIPQVVGHTPPEWVQKYVGNIPNFVSIDPYCSKSFNKSRYRYVIIEKDGVTLYDSVAGAKPLNMKGT